MADIKDILGVPRAGAAASNEQSQPAAKPKYTKMQRPAGMSREAFALLGDSHPIISSQLIASSLKKKDAKAKPKPSTKGIPTWSYKPFSNSARSDGLELKRWTKGYKDVHGRMREPEETDYYFARFNKKVQMLRYSDEEWESIIKGDSGDWSRMETDYLFDLCDRFDLRFPVIADRYEFLGGPPRTIEDLKERYYYVARKLLVAREGGEAAVANQPLVRCPFNKQHELDRKKAVQALLTRSLEQTQAENAVLAEARQIEERRKAEAAAAAAAAARAVRASSTPTPAAPGLNGAVPSRAGAASPAPLFPATDLRFPSEFSNAVEPGTPSLFDANLNPSKPPKPGVYGRGANATALALAMPTSMAGGARSAKAVEQLLADLAWLPAIHGPRVNTRAVSGAWLALRAEVVALVELRRMVQGKAATDTERKPIKGTKKKGA